jgi:hypothetical protein
MFSPSPIEFSAMLVRERQLPLALPVGKTLPQSHGEFSPITSWKLEELCQSGEWHALMFSRAEFGSKSGTDSRIQNVPRAVPGRCFEAGVLAHLKPDFHVSYGLGRPGRGWPSTGRPLAGMKRHGMVFGVRRRDRDCQEHARTGRFVPARSDRETSLTGLKSWVAQAACGFDSRPRH